MKKTLIIPHFDTFNGFDGAAKADISEYVWGDSYCPKAEARIFYTDDAFYIHLEAEESADHLRMEKSPGITDSACEDSCLEFFVMPCSETDKRYFNFEFTPKGALYAGFGHDRYDNKLLTDTDISIFDIHTNVEINEEKAVWYSEARIPFDFICETMQKDIVFVKDKTMFGNFYKCGDKCKEPHYGTWNPVGSDKPDYHLPEYFGKLMLG